MRWWWLMLAVSLAGCAETAEPAATEAPELVEGTLRGVVVDAAIVPVAGAQVILVGTAFETTTDVDGVFSFSGVPPGTYVLEVSTLIHEPTQVTVVIGDGPAEPVKVPMKDVASSGIEPPAVMKVAPATSSESESFSTTISSVGTKYSSQTIASPTNM